MLTIFYLFVALMWLVIAFAPFYLLWRRMKRVMAISIALPFALLWSALPFWDYFFMVPAVNAAYERLAVNKIYKVSDSRKIRIRHWKNDEELGGGYLDYDEALLAGKLDFIEKLEFVRNEDDVLVPKLVRYTLHPLDSEACQQRKYGNQLKDKQYCIAYDVIDESAAEVVIDSGTVYIVPFSIFPDKKFEYSFWRVNETLSNERVAEMTRSFIWDPQICRFFDACRYVVDRNGPGQTPYADIMKSLPAISNK